MSKKTKHRVTIEFTITSDFDDPKLIEKAISSEWCLISGGATLPLGNTNDEDGLYRHVFYGKMSVRATKVTSG